LEDQISVPNKQNNARTVREERSKREKRAEQILDAAAELVLRWSYKKTTIDDIARQAGVAKGTIYLHWKSREDLFEALVLREWLLTVREVQKRVLADPDGMRLHVMMRHATLVTLSRPLLKSLFMRDADMWGDIIQRSGTPKEEGQEIVSLYGQRMIFLMQVIELLRAKGMLRTDMSVAELLHMLSAITFGYLSIGQYLPDSLQLPAEVVANQVAEVVQLTMEPQEEVTREVLQEVGETLRAMYSKMEQLVEASMRKEMQ
jgi:AcrR family transcriptional regulator